MANDGGCIGLIADSHGNLDATAEAIRLLKGRGAEMLVHLGDFCDSVRRDRAGAMIALLRENCVLAVKGNNDLLVENMLSEQQAPDPDGDRTIDFLRGVPVTRALNGLLFAHSLPFDSLRSVYEPIDTGNTRRAERLFAETDFQLLFCGHSHLPVIFRKSGPRVTREQSPPGERLIPAAERFIVVVGAADEGECALYNREAGTYERIRIFSKEDQSWRKNSSV